jgi:hypothetical protein
MKKIETFFLFLVMGCSFSTAEAATPRLPFSLVVHEGFGSIAVGDLNTTLISINSGYDRIRSLDPPWGCTGEILPIPHRYTDWEVGLQWDFWRGFGIGITISAPAQFSGTSFLTHNIMQDGLNQTENHTYASHIKVSAPVKVSLHKSFVLLRNFSASLSGGLGFYTAQMTQNYLSQLRLPLGGQVLTTMLFDVRGRHLGSHLGIALEFNLNRRISLVASGQWRSIIIDTLKGEELLEAQWFDAAGNLDIVFSETFNGLLYHYIGQDSATGLMREKLLVSEIEPPWYGIDLPSDIRNAYIDLGGFTLKVGIKIGLF